MERKRAMTSAESNRVRQVREARGVSQIALAAATGLSRQSVGAIEAGRAVPAVDVALRLARALGCPVEQLFGVAEPPRLTPEFSSSPMSGRVALAQIAGRWVSYPLVGDSARLSADGLVAGGASERPEVELLRPLVDVRNNLVMMGCAAALGLLADRLNSCSGAGRFLWFGRSSTAALEALARGHAHVAGVHLTDADTGEANVADVRRHPGVGAVVLITLARWEAGLVAAPGNPRRIRGPAELGRRGLRLVTREPGSGAQRLLERALQREGIRQGTTMQLQGHFEVAHAVSIGVADVGIATRDAAIVHGLHFVPLAEERYDLVIPLHALDDPRIQRLLDTLTAAACRGELSSLGYDVRSSGDRVAEIKAA